jgi:hypothetical protein
MNSTWLDKQLVERIHEVKNFRAHKKRIQALDYSGLSVLDPHPIASASEIKARKVS